MKYISILEKLATILERNNRVFQQTLLNKLIARLRNGEEPSILITNDIWGGEGSITDCDLHSSPDGLTEPPKDAEKDEKELQGLIADLAERLLVDHLVVSEIIAKRMKDVGARRAELAGRLDVARRIRNM